MRQRGDDSGNSRFYEFNYGDKLRLFKRQTGTTEATTCTHYLYDTGGNRVKKITRKQGGGFQSVVNVDGVFEHTRESSFAKDVIPFLEIGKWKISGTTTGEQCVLHIMDGQSRIATIRTGDALGDTTPTIKYNLEDHLNSSTMLVDSVGTLVNREEYYPFGETSFGSYEKKRYRYNGKEKDEESGLYNYGMRYYSAWTCRFMSVDPLAGKYAHLTPYQYAGNDPVNQIDIDGLEGDKTQPSQQSGGNIGAQTSDNTKTSGPIVTRKMMQSINSGGSSNSSTAKPDFSNITLVEPTRKDNTSQGYTENAKKETAAQVNSNKIEQANTRAAVEKRINDGPKLIATRQTTDELIGLTRRQRNWEKNVILNPNSIYNPQNYNRFEMRLARAAGDGLVIGVETIASEIAIAKAFQLYSRFSRTAGVSSEVSVNMNATDWGSAPMKIERILPKGTKIADLIDEAKYFTFSTGDEAAVVRLVSGERALVSGGPGGIRLTSQVKKY